MSDRPIVVANVKTNHYQSPGRRETVEYIDDDDEDTHSDDLDADNNYENDDMNSPKKNVSPDLLSVPFVYLENAELNSWFSVQVLRSTGPAGVVDPPISTVHIPGQESDDEDEHPKTAINSSPRKSTQSPTKSIKNNANSHSPAKRGTSNNNNDRAIFSPSKVRNFFPNRIPKSQQLIGWNFSCCIVYRVLAVER